MEVYKLNIFKYYRDIYTESAISPFVNIHPLYININRDAEEDQYESILTIIATTILDKENEEYHFDYDGKLEFCLMDNYYDDCETSVFVDCSKNVIIGFIKQYKLVVLRMTSDKYWSKVYIQLDTTSEKGSDYTNDEITQYVRKMFKMMDMPK